MDSRARGETARFVLKEPPKSGIRDPSMPGADGLWQSRPGRDPGRDEVSRLRRGLRGEISPGPRTQMDWWPLGSRRL